MTEDLFSGSHEGIRMSQILGIGSAERHWKIVMAVNTGQRANIVTIKFRNQSLIYGASMQQKARY